MWAFREIPVPRIGSSSRGSAVYAAYRPKALSLANAISWISKEEGRPNLHIPVPTGMSLGANRAHNQIQLALDSFETPVFALFRLFGAPAYFAS